MFFHDVVNGLVSDKYSDTGLINIVKNGQGDDVLIIDVLIIDVLM